jgi:hypothetical protein
MCLRERGHVFENLLSEPEQLASYNTSALDQEWRGDSRRLMAAAPSIAEGARGAGTDGGDTIERPQWDDLSVLGELCTGVRRRLRHHRRGRRDMRLVDQARIEECRLAIGGASSCPFGGIFGNPNTVLHYMPRPMARIITVPARGAKRSAQGRD